MHDDYKEYFKFTGRARFEKSINSFIGLIEGISVDSIINPAEIAFLNLWLKEHEGLKNRHPYNELLPTVETAILDRILTTEEKEDILWLCRKLCSAEYFDQATADIQRLHAVLGAIASDGAITEAELRGLSDWLYEHEHLRTCWPYEEVGSLITGVLRDKKIDISEHSLLKEFFMEFVSVLDNRTIVSPKISLNRNVVGLCAVCPDISFSGSRFCFTGTSHKYTRVQFSQTVKQHGGEVLDNISAKVDYLIIGADGNPCWAYACYGRKVEKAVELRKAGSRLLLVHENDFHDALADI
jgi:hypothetical protein